MTTEANLRAAIAGFARSLFERGYTAGSSGNISVRVEDGVLITPTNSSLGALDPDRIAKVDRRGAHVAGDPPSKEIFLHQAFYETRASAGAVVHLHSPYATAISCLDGTDVANAIPPITPYVVMRVGDVPLLPYLRPGAPDMGDLIRSLGGKHAAVLLANHGPVVSGRDLSAAVYASEELEETARLVVILNGRRVNRLSDSQVAELRATFGAP